MPKDSNSTPETQVKPDPVLEKRTRRIYTVEYKMKIIAQANAEFCKIVVCAAAMRIGWLEAIRAA